MTETDDLDSAPADAAPGETLKRPGERLAKAIARAGLGSRREAEVWIEQGRVKINGETVSTAATNVLPEDRVEVDGRPLPARERTRLWLYHKPRGYVTTTHDPEGRETVFSILPESLPRVMTIGRLDINTEGLLLLTNDGGLARVLELPETGWLRRYRVRAFGRANPQALEALKDGVEIDGFAYGAIEAEIERQQADNVWLRFALREGKNREVKRVAEHLGLAVNRLIRISFGPFQLGQLAEGEVEEVRTRTLVDQLGKRLMEEAGCDFEAPATSFGEDAPRMTGGRGAGRSKAPTERSKLADPSQRVGRRAPVVRPRDMAAPAAAPADAGEQPTKTRRAAPIADRKGRTVKVERVARDAADAPAKRVRKRDEGAAERFGAPGRPARPPRPGAKPDAGASRTRRRDDAAGGERPARFGARDEGKSGVGRSGDRPAYGDKRPQGRRPDAGAPERAGRPARAKPFERRPEGAPSGDRPRPSAPRSPNPRFRDDVAPSGAERAPRGPRPTGGRSERPTGDRSASPRPPRGDRPDGPRPGGEGRPEARPSRAKPFERRPDAAPSGDRPRPSAPRTANPRWRDDAAPAVTERTPRGSRPTQGRPDRPTGDRRASAQPPRSGGGRPRPDVAEGGASRPPRGDRPGRDGKPDARPPRGKPFAGKPSGGQRSGAGSERPAGAGSRYGGAKPAGDGPRGPRPSGGKPGGYKPGGSKPGGFKPRGPGGPSRGPGGSKGRPGGADRRR